MTTNKLNEQIYVEHLNNGLDIIIMPKNGYTKKYAIFATHFGSINNKFIKPGEQEVTIVPDGIAHFLEHKLFEEKDGLNALDKLSKLGANPNAYTSFNHTAYLFESTAGFDECLDILLNFVQNPYFTDENVEKEKGIIGQEIKMYDDDPEWQLFFGFLNCLYSEHPITKDIAGTISSISKITPEILYDCYNTFYDPSNMVICVVGDVDIKSVISKIKSRVKNSEEKQGIKRIYGNEPDKINKKRIEKKMNVSIPNFIMGFKDNSHNEIIESGYRNNDNEIIKRHIAIEIIMEMLVGKSTELYETMYNNGLVSREIETAYTFEENYAYSSISCESIDPDKVINIITNRIEELKKIGIDKSEFERIKKMLYGEYVKLFNNISKIATMLVSDYFKGVNSLDYLDGYKIIDKNYVENILKEHFNFDYMGVSIIKP